MEKQIFLLQIFPNNSKDLDLKKKKAKRVSKDVFKDVLISCSIEEPGMKMCSSVDLTEL